MAQFEQAIGPLLENEGGYGNNPKDRGGETKYGISKKYFPDVDIPSLTKKDAIAIYKKHYWPRSLDKIEDQTIATKVFDLGVNTGVGTAIKMLQQAVNEVVPETPPLVVDGRMGPTTAARANKADPARLLKAIQDSAARHYCNIVKQKPDQREFLRGWLLRAYDRPRDRSEPMPKVPADVQGVVDGK